MHQNLLNSLLSIHWLQDVGQILVSGFHHLNSYIRNLPWSNNYFFCLALVSKGVTIPCSLGKASQVLLWLWKIFKEGFNMSFGTPHVFQQQNKISNSLCSKHRFCQCCWFKTYLILALCKNGVCNRHLVFNQSATATFLEKTNMYL